MFYEKKPNAALRFGDVVKGLILTYPDITEPTSIKDYKIDIRSPDYCVILTPCCSIGEKTISLTPLIKLRNSFFDNPYFVDDLTRINREMESEQAVSPEIWKNFPTEKKQEKLAEGIVYAFIDLFIYEGNPLFDTYIVNRKNKENIKTNFYMIDFKNIHKISCNKILSPEKSPLELKQLQLAIETRSELRNKLASYYGKPPKEDKILED